MMQVEYYTEYDPKLGTVKCIAPSHVLNMYHEVFELSHIIVGKAINTNWNDLRNSCR